MKVGKNPRTRVEKTLAGKAGAITDLKSTAWGKKIVSAIKMSHQRVSTVPQRLQDVGHQLLVPRSSGFRIVMDVVGVRDQQRWPKTISLFHSLGNS